MAEAKRSTSIQFADQIRQLELEGSRLMAATSGLGDSLGLSSLSMSTRLQDTPHTRCVSPSLRALTDISAEQRTIDEMRQQLDAQSRETERLTKDLLGDGNGFRYSSSNSLLDKLDIPSSRSVSSRSHLSTAVNTDDFQYMTRLQLERELRDSKQDVTSSRSQLADIISISEKQKEHFRTTIEELKGKLQEAVIGKDMLLNNKKRETAGQEATIYKLQQTVDHLEQSNRRQEETILEQKKKLDTLQREQYVMDMALSQVRGLLLEQERRRGRPFYEGENLSSQDCTLLIRSLERCVQELDTELQMKTTKNRQLHSELENLKTIAEEKCRLLAIESQERLSMMQSEHEKQLDVASERSLNAKQQVESMQDQLQSQQHQKDQQMKLKEEYISELEDRLRNHRSEQDEEAQSWKERREALEMACDNSQRELSLLKQEREENIRKSAVLESRFDDLQQTVVKLEKESEDVKFQKMALLEQEKNLTLKEGQLQSRLQEKDREIADLRTALEGARLEHQGNLQQTISSLEKEGKLKAAEENQMLSTQLASVTERCYKLNMENELTKSQQENLREKYEDLKGEYTALKEQLMSSQSRKEQMSELMQSRTAELDKYAQERDRQCRLLDERNAEISDLKATREKLTIQLEEREKNFLSLQQQNDKMMETVEHTGKSQRDVKEERDELMQRMNDKIIETEEIRHERDSVVKKLRIREKHLQEFQGDNVKLAEDLRDIRAEYEQSSKEKDSLYEELKESRYDVSNLKEEVTVLQHRLEDKQGDMGKEINKLSHKLKASDHDLRLARKALKTREHVDGTAVKVAGKMQKAVTQKRGQIDTLQSKIRWLEECLENDSKEKKLLKEEREKQAKTLKRSIDQNDRLRSEVQEYIRKNKGLREKVNKMEAALEKAAVKHASSQAQVEQYEQDLARLKLKHQLEVKEVERGGHKAMSLPKACSMVSRDNPHEHVLDDDLPSSVSAQGCVRDTAATDDLHALVAEMKSVLNTHKMRSSHDQPGESEMYQRRQQALEEDRRTARDLLAKLKALDLENEARESHRSSDLTGIMRPTKLISSTKHSHDKLDTVSDLLTYNDLESNVSEATLDSVDDFRPSKYRSAHDPIVNDLQTHELCKRLEKRIENLSKMGGHLQKENKEMSQMMRDQDKKLQKVKRQLVK